jgi:hypothetical protein
MQYHKDSQAWAQTHFSHAQMGDVRRIQRVVTVAQAMAAHAGQSIPQLVAQSYEVKAAYNLFKRPEATPHNLQAGHRELVREALHQPGVYLLVEDTTEMIWSTTQPIDGLGPVGGGHVGLQGFHLHSVLALRWTQPATARNPSQRPPVEVIGLCDQQYYVRQPRPPGERDEDSLARKKRARESRVWEEASERLGRAPKAVRWIRVADRGADIYEHLRCCHQLGHGFVIRAAQDRAVVDSCTGQPRGRLFEQARATAELGEFQLELRARGMDITV